MGRQAATVREIRAQIGEQHEAVAEMNDELRAKRESITERLTDARAGNVRFNYQLGLDLLEVEANEGDKYGDGKPLMKLMRSLQQDERLLRKCKQFASTVSLEELDELLAQRNDEAKFVLHWGHISLLLALNTHKQRLTFAERAARGLWDPPTLQDAIRRRLGGSSRGDGHGRPHSMPPTIRRQIKQMHTKTDEWLKKARTVWDGEEQSVVNNVLEAPAAELEDDHLAMLNELVAMLSSQQAQVKSLLLRVKEARGRVQNVLEARDREEAAAEVAEHNAQQERERSIDLQDTNAQQPARPGQRRRSRAGAR